VIIMPYGHASPIVPGHRCRPTFGTREVTWPLQRGKRPSQARPARPPFPARSVRSLPRQSSGTRADRRSEGIAEIRPGLPSRLGLPDPDTPYPCRQLRNRRPAVRTWRDVPRSMRSRCKTARAWGGPGRFRLWAAGPGGCYAGAVAVPLMKVCALFQSS
jgi:hypothetical protein